MCPISQTTKEMQNKKLHRLTKCEQCIASRSVEIYSFKCISEKKQIFVLDFMSKNLTTIQCKTHSFDIICFKNPINEYDLQIGSDFNHKCKDFCLQLR